MSDQFSQFHYKLSKSSYQPDYEAEGFDVKDIYIHSTLKVSGIKHDKTQSNCYISPFNLHDSTGRVQQLYRWISCSQTRSPSLPRVLKITKLCMSRLRGQLSQSIRRLNHNEQTKSMHVFNKYNLEVFTNKSEQQLIQSRFGLESTPLFAANDE